MSTIRALIARDRYASTASGDLYVTTHEVDDGPGYALCWETVRQRPNWAGGSAMVAATWDASCGHTEADALAFHALLVAWGLAGLDGCPFPATVRGEAIVMAPSRAMVRLDIATASATLATVPAGIGSTATGAALVWRYLQRRGAIRPMRPATEGGAVHACRLQS